MAHDLNIRDDQVAMMYVGSVPWHGLGTELEQPATAEEAIQAAKLDWQVSKIQIPEKQDCVGEERYAVVREDRWPDHSDCVLGFAGPEYTPLQNREAFGFFDSIVGDGAAIYHTAGALGKGERVWIMAKLPGDIRVIGDDITQKFLLLSNSHDGRSAVEIKFTPVRVVCQNTLTMALSQGPTLRIPHSKNICARLAETGALLRAIHLRFEEAAETFKGMAVRQISKNDVQAYLKKVFPDPPQEVGDYLYATMMAQAQTDRAIAEYLFDQGRGNYSGPAKGTLWAAYNGVTEYVDHKRYRGLSIGRRWGQLWFGSGSREKDCAYRAAVNILRARVDNSMYDSVAREPILAQLRRESEQRSLDTRILARLRRELEQRSLDTEYSSARNARYHSGARPAGRKDLQRVG